MRYPNLSHSSVISFDIETYDPELREKGPGVYRKDGNILGIAIGNDKGFKEYYNLGHSKIPPELKEKNLNYIKSVLALPCKKLGTNILYDLDWLENWDDIKVNGELHDIQIAEPLINENQIFYNLDFLGQKYLNVGKEKTKVDEYCQKHNLPGDIRRWLWRMDYETVKDYAIRDIELPLEIFKKQWSILKEEDLLYLYHIEAGLIRLLLQMRKEGVRINLKQLTINIEEMQRLIKAESNFLFNKYGKFNYNSSQQIAKVLNKLNIPYPLTEKGNPNLDKEILKQIDKDVTNQILIVKEAEKILSTFLINALYGHQINGVIHCSFNPLKSDEYGTISGRFSSSNPNLQQIPSQEETYGNLCRSLFIPLENHFWAKLDYSQIEYRIIAHFAIGPKSEEVRENYNNNPDTDYHQLIMDWTGLNRKNAKIANFGVSYFMGIKTFMKKFNWAQSETEQLMENYFKEVPFIIPTRKHIVQIAKGRGFIKTILNRRARVTTEMRDNKKEYSMFNRLIQGTAADILKKAMKDAYDDGIFNVLKPHLTVHDELDVSVSKDKSKENFEALKELKHTMEHVVKLKVPIVVNVGLGKNWATAKDYDLKQGVLNL